MDNLLGYPKTLLWLFYPPSQKHLSHLTFRKRTLVFVIWNKKCQVYFLAFFFFFTVHLLQTSYLSTSDMAFFFFTSMTFLIFVFKFVLNFLHHTILWMLPIFQNAAKVLLSGAFPDCFLWAALECISVQLMYHF